MTCQQMRRKMMSTTLVRIIIEVISSIIPNSEQIQMTQHQTSNIIHQTSYIIRDTLLHRITRRALGFAIRITHKNDFSKIHHQKTVKLPLHHGLSRLGVISFAFAFDFAKRKESVLSRSFDSLDCSEEQQKHQQKQQQRK